MTTTIGVDLFNASRASHFPNKNLIIQEFLHTRFAILPLITEVSAVPRDYYLTKISTFFAFNFENQVFISFLLGNPYLSTPYLKALQAENLW